MNSLKKKKRFGVLFRWQGASGVPHTGYIFATEPQQACAGKRAGDGIGDSLAFAGVYLFTVLLYVRPNELFPGLLGEFPITKLVAIATAAIYIASRLNQNKALTIWSFEISMMASMTLLAVMLMPAAASPQDTVNVLQDKFFKVVVIFVLMINLINTRERLRWSLQLVVIGGFALGLDGIRSFLAGELYRGRIRGASVGGVFGNPNDLAAWLVMLLPVAVTLALTRKGLVRLAYLGVAIVLGLAVLVTFSRGGFLGLIAMGGVLLWKLRRRNRFLLLVSTMLLAGALILLMPTSYGSRLATIFRPESDSTGSAQLRQAVLERGLVLAARHSVVGIGMGNFHIYSIQELRAHNAYVEVWAELGALGFIAYLTLILVPFRKLWYLERGAIGGQDEVSIDIYYLSVGLQSELVAYIVCSFFGSIQYEWFLYYPVAYAVSLKVIRDRKNAGVKAKSGMGTLFGHAADGLLWRPHQLGAGHP